MVNVLRDMRKRMYDSGMFNVPHSKLCDTLMNSLNRSVVIDFPEFKHVYTLIGHSNDTKKVLGCTFKSNKIDGKADKSYKASLRHALNAIPLPMQTSFIAR